MKQEQIDALLVPYHHYLWPQVCWSTAGMRTRLMERFLQTPGIVMKDLEYTRVKHWIEGLSLERKSTYQQYKRRARRFFRWLRGIFPFATFVPTMIKVLARFPVKPCCDFCGDEAEGTMMRALENENGEIVCERCFAVYSTWLVEPLFCRRHKAALPVAIRNSRTLLSFNLC